ncbi:MAG: hypothetical protein ACOY5Y_13950 [Pseudomonadota bacterium]
MRILHLALVAALFVAPGAASAQSTADAMMTMAKQIRTSVEQLKGQLPAEDLAQMLKQADEIEQAVRDGKYADAPAAPKEPTLSERLMAQHGRLDWLAREAACAGYTQENFRTFRFSSAINDRDTHCRNAYGHWATYVDLVRNGRAAEGADQALFYYDAAARRAVEHYGGK